MQVIPLQALPSQAFSVSLDGNQWDFVIKTTNGTISITLSLNGNPVIANLRAVTGSGILPSRYEEAGNFVFVTQNFQVPDYTQFGGSQQLLYFSADELIAIRKPPPAPIIPADFDQNAALPLRIFPQGYKLATGLYSIDSGFSDYLDTGHGLYSSTDAGV